MVTRKNSIKLRTATLFAAGAIMLAPAMPVTSSLIAMADSTGSYVTLNSFSGQPGVALNVSGGGFASNEVVVITAVQNGSQVARLETKANQFGEISTSLNLPVRMAQGSVAIKAVGATSGMVSENGYYVTPYNATITTSAGNSAPYSSLAVSGKGFAPNETVNLNLAGSLATVKADVNGAFKGATVVTPNVPAASYTLVAAGAESGASAVAYQYIDTFYASASPTAYYVMPLTSLGFNGSGYASGETITVTEAKTGAVMSSFAASAAGDFKNGGAFSVPADFSGTSKQFVLTGSKSLATSAVTVAIGQYFPSVAPAVYYVMPGGAINFNGSGFIAGETVEIRSGSTVVATVTADTFGGFSKVGNVITTADQAGTALTYTLYGQTSHGSGSATVQVGAYNPNASPSGYYVMPGSVVTFSGTGFAPSELVAVFSGTTSLGSFSADETGAFIAQGGQAVAYNLANGNASFTLKGSVSKAAQTFKLAVGQLQTQLSPSNYFVLPYQAFDVTASGFAPEETLTLKNGTTTLATAKTDAKGIATFTGVSLPANELGSATLVANGDISGATATVSVGMGNYYPSVTADNYYTRAGSTVVLSGTGFAPSEDVTVTVMGVSKTVSSDKNGVFETSVDLPFGSTKNTMDIVSVGSLSGASSTTTISLAPFMASVNPSTWYATPGTAVTFDGSGFVPGEDISVALNGTVIGTEKASAKGLLASTGSYALPFQTKAASFVVTGLTSGSITTMGIGLGQFYAGVQLESYYGNGGANVVTSGNGFAPNETVVLTSGTKTIATFKADKTGAFSGSVKMPYAAAGKVALVATGAISGAKADTAYTVAQVYSGIQMQSYVVKAGQSFGVTGGGFLPNDTVTISSRLGIFSFTTDASGSFTKTFPISNTIAAGDATLTFKGMNSFTSQDITIYVQDKNAQ